MHEPSVQRSKGPLFDDPRAPAKTSDESDFISRLVGTFSKSNSDMETENQEPSLKTDNEDMERLMQPLDAFDDEEEEDND